MLASAIAFRRLDVHSTDCGSTYTDGRTIFVDASADAGDLRDTVAVQAALLAGGSLEKDLIIRLTRQRRNTVERYLAFELGRVVDQLGQVLPARTICRVKSLGVESLSAGSLESLERALSRETIAAAPDWAGTILPARLRRANEADLRAAPTDTDLSRLSDLEEQVQQDDHPDEEGEESKIVNLLSAPGMSNPLGDALQRLLGMGRSAPDKKQGSGELPVTKQRFGQVGRNARKGLVRQTLSALFEPAPVSGIRYPEWDCHKGVYRPDWCGVAEFDPAEID